MSFSKPQQGIYRRLVEAAWRKECATNPAPVGDTSKSMAKEKWYRAVLHGEFGVWTTKQLNPARDFERVCATFEALVGESIYWQMRMFRGDANRILFTLGKLAADHNVDERYLRAIARSCLQMDELPDLHQLPPDLLVVVLRSAKIFVKRREESEPDGQYMAGIEANFEPEEQLAGDPF